MVSTNLFDSFANLPRVPDLSLPDPPHVQAFHSLVQRIKEFESSLAETEAVGAMLASFGSAVHLQLRSITRHGQYFCLTGITDDGGEATLVQHYTQTSILLLKVTAKADIPKRPIGFNAE